MNYYNEFDPKAAAWLRELIKQKLIPNGVVDERSIVDVRPSDLGGFAQCHFFAGIGGWPYALQLAGWPSDRPIWTGSCPCQPFSCAGKQRGVNDERHLWPAFFNLIRECRPATVVGEQVASAIGHGWLDGVCTDLEGEGYACGAAVLGAHSVGAPHIRQRLYWLADNNNKGLQGRDGAELRECPGERSAWEGCSCGGVGDSDLSGCEAFRNSEVWTWESDEAGLLCPWSSYNVIQCRDGKRRRIPVESAFFPLANGVPGRVVRLRGYGNAVVPHVAAAFVNAYMEDVK